MAFRTDRMIALRKELGLNQSGLAEVLAVTQTQISKYERGDVNPGSENLIAIAQALNTSADYLLDLSNIPHPDAEPDPLPNLSPEQIEMVEVMAGESAAKQRKLVALVRMLLDVDETE